MSELLIYVPQNAVGMSVTLVQELCAVAAMYAGRQEDVPKLVSLDGKAVTSFANTKISVDYSLKSAPDAQAVFVCAFWGDTKEALMREAEAVSWFKALAMKGVPLAALSNGPFFLAKAGLLSDKVATVYPPTANEFSHMFPDVALRPERAITDAGNLYCANGIASGCDLAISVIEQLHGPEIARRVAKDFLIGFNRSYSSSNVNFDGQKYHKDTQILTAQNWIERNFGSEVSLEAVAADVGMSPRNFSRRFKLATGDTPRDYLKRARLEAAQELFRDNQISVAEVAYKVGFQDVGYFAKVFNEYSGCSPHDYAKTAS